MTQVSSIQTQSYDGADRVAPVRQQHVAPGLAVRRTVADQAPKPDIVSLSDQAVRSANIAQATLDANLSPVPADLGIAQGDPPVKAFAPEDIAALIGSFGTKSGEDSFDLAFDLNADGVIDSKDLNQALAGAQPAKPTQVEQVQGAFGTSRGQGGFNATLDYNKDGVIDSKDLNEALKNA